jgi:hypothetical protein
VPDEGFEFSNVKFFHADDIRLMKELNLRRGVRSLALEQLETALILNATFKRHP